MFYVLITSYFYIIHHIFSNYLFHHFQYVTFARTAEADELYEAIPVWERAYAVTKTKRCVKGAAGTRGADKVIAETPFSELTGCTPTALCKTSDVAF